MPGSVQLSQKASERINVREEADATASGKRVWLARLQSASNFSVIAFACALCLPMTVNWIALIVGLVLWAGVLALRTACGERVYYRPPLTWPLLGMAVAALVSGCIHGGLAEGYSSVMSLRPMIAYFWAYDAFVRNERLQTAALSALLALSTVAGFWGTFQQVTGFHIGFKYLQGTGFLSGPMAFAGQMQLFSLMAMALLFTGGYKKLSLMMSDVRWFSVVFAGNVLGLIFAFERSAWLGFAFGAVIVTVLVSWRLAAKVAAASATAFVVAWNVDSAFRQRILSSLDWQHDVSTRARLVVWEQAWKSFQAKPIFGLGVNNFPHVYVPEALVPGQAQYLGHAHSNYLHILATTGIFGFCAYIWLLVASVRQAWMQFVFSVPGLGESRSAKDATFRRAVGLGMLGALVSLAVAGIFEYNFGTSQVRMAEWFLLAFLIERPRRATQDLS